MLNGARFYELSAWRGGLLVIALSPAAVHWPPGGCVKPAAATSGRVTPTIPLGSLSASSVASGRG